MVLRRYDLYGHMDHKVLDNFDAAVALFSLTTNLYTKYDKLSMPYSREDPSEYMVCDPCAVLAIRISAT
jgi:hypothetical protein